MPPSARPTPRHPGHLPAGGFPPAATDDLLALFNAPDAPGDDGPENGWLTSRRQRVQSARRNLSLSQRIMRAAAVVVALLLFWWLVGEDWYTAWRQYELRAELAEQFESGIAVDAPAIGFADLLDPVTGVEDDPRIVADDDESVEEAPPPPAPVTVAALPDEDTSGEAAADPEGSHAAPIGRIRIPAIGVDWAVGKGVEVPDLKAGPGWMPETAPLGSPGNSVLSGHRTTYGAPFNRLDELEVGDRITVSVPGKPDAIYEVRDLFIVAPTEVGVVNPTGGARLTLTTCHPKGSARERLIVQAEQIEGPGAAAAVSADDWRRYSGNILRRGSS